MPPGLTEKHILIARKIVLRMQRQENYSEILGFGNTSKKDLEEKEDALVAKQDEVLQTLTRVLRRQEMDTVVVTCKERSSRYDENGKKVIIEKEVPQLVRVPTKVSDLNKAAELLGKRYALFTDKVKTDVDMDLNITIDYGDNDNEES